jgi:hypothetical protein
MQVVVTVSMQLLGQGKPLFDVVAAYSVDADGAASIQTTVDVAIPALSSLFIVFVIWKQLN